MTLIFISSGFLALVDNEAAGMIKEVLGLSFEVIKSMVWGIVLIGGLTLILANILLTRITMINTIKKITLRYPDGLINCLRQPGQFSYEDLKATLRRLSVNYGPERSFFF